MHWVGCTESSGIDPPIPEDSNKGLDSLGYFLSSIMPKWCSHIFVLVRVTHPDLEATTSSGRRQLLSIDHFKLRLHSDHRFRSLPIASKVPPSERLISQAMAVPESMTVFDISGQYTMVRGLILVTIFVGATCGRWCKPSQRSFDGRHLLHLCHM